MWSSRRGGRAQAGAASRVGKANQRGTVLPSGLHRLSPGAALSGAERRAYTEINVRAAPGAEARVREWTGGPLISPVFDIDGTIVIDFKRAELTRVLGLD